MKTLIISAVLIFFSTQLTIATGFTKSSENKNFKINNNVGPAELSFVSDAPLEKIKGTVDKEVVSGWVKMDPANLEATTGKVSFKVLGMETGIRKRDGHLHSNYWLDAEKYPDIWFDLKKMKDVKIIETSSSKSTAEAMAIGSFNLHGKSKEVEVQVKMIYINESDATKKRAPGDLFSVEGTFEITLADYDVKGANNLIGERVGKTISISFKMFYNSTDKSS